MSPNTKDATWQYLQTLYMLGTTITSIPDDTLSMIEGLLRSVQTRCKMEMVSLTRMPYENDGWYAWWSSQKINLTYIK